MMQILHDVHFYNFIVNNWQPILYNNHIKTSHILDNEYFLVFLILFTYFGVSRRPGEQFY